MKANQFKLAEKNGKEQFQSFRHLPFSGSFVLTFKSTISLFLLYQLFIQL